jgi:hypothetical protein
MTRPYLEKGSATEYAPLPALLHAHRTSPSMSMSMAVVTTCTRHGFFVRMSEQKVEIEAFDTTGHIFEHITVPS